MTTWQSADVTSSSSTRQVFRTSAIFYAWEDHQVTTGITFMGYWRHKRGIPEIGLRVTLRDMSGRTVARLFRIIDSEIVTNIQVRDLLDTVCLNLPFYGSCEVEGFASRDLGVSFPAMIAEYRGDGFSSYVHTYGRAYNGPDDALYHPLTVNESDWMVLDSDRFESFAVYHNGVSVVESAKMDFQFYNYQGERYDYCHQLGTLQPYQTVSVFPGREFDLARFLSGQPGWSSFSTPGVGVFPRCLSGNRDKGTGAVALNHTYYDLRNKTDYVPGNLACRSFPVTLGQAMNTTMTVYPTFCPGQYRFAVDLCDGNGASLLRLDPWTEITTETTDLRILDIGGVIRKSSIDPSQVKRVNVEARPESGRLPERININLGLRMDQNLPVDIPHTLLTDGQDGRRRTYIWAPVYAEECMDRRLLLANDANGFTGTEPAKTRISLFHDQSGESRQVDLVLSPGMITDLALEEMFNDVAGFLGGSTGWIVIESAKPDLGLWFMGSNSRGSVALEHGFGF